MDSKRPLILDGRRPTPEEAMLPARWLLVMPEWTEHDGPEVFQAHAGDDEVAWLTCVGPDVYELAADGTDQDDEKWIGVDRLAQVVQY